MSLCSTTQAYVSIRQRTAAYISIRRHTDESLLCQCASTTQSCCYYLYYTKPFLLALLLKSRHLRGTARALRRSVLRALAAPTEAVKLVVKLVVKRPARLASAAAALTRGSTRALTPRPESTPLSASSSSVTQTRVSSPTEGIPAVTSSGAPPWPLASKTRSVSQFLFKGL